jgi:flagellar basal-body rod modification protein FlgD
LAQLANQDPTAPQASEAMVAQMAQFANLELMQNANGNLEALLVAEAAGNQTAVAELVGKDVVYRTDKVQLGPTGPGSTLEIKLPREASEVIVTIKDEDGNVVDSANLGANEAGSVDFNWDGTDAAGNRLPSGTYTIEVSATNATGDPIEGIQTGARSHIDGISFANGFPELILGSLKIGLGDVVEVTEPRTSDAAPDGDAPDPDAP